MDYSIPGPSDVGAGVIGGLLEGIGQGAKDFFEVQQAKQKMNIAQQELDSKTKYQNAQIDYLEDRGTLAGQQADAYRFLIKKATDPVQTQIDAAGDQIDAAHTQVQAKVGGYRQMLNQALQTPEGQDYLANSTGGTSEATGMPTESLGPAPNMSGAGSPVVNTVMPGVGANQARTTVPTTSYGLGTQLNKAAGLSGPAGGKRNATLQKAMGNIDAMGIDNREDAQFAMEKYYGADWNQNPEATAFLDQKFGKTAPAGGANAGQPYVQTSEGAAVPSGGAGGAAPAPAAGGASTDLVPVTGPDGNAYKVPRANLQKALQRGYRAR